MKQPPSSQAQWPPDSGASAVPAADRPGNSAPAARPGTPGGPPPGPLAWLSPRRFTPGERRWIAGYTLALMALTTLPYALLAGRAAPGSVYPWLSTFHFDDYFQYFAWARHIAGGDWLIRNYYTPAGQAGFGLFNPFFLLMGWLYGLTGNFYLTHHLLRLAAVAAFGWVSYAFAALFLPRPPARRWAQVLMLGGGLEFPAFLATHARGGIERAWLVSPVADIHPYKLLYRAGHLTACLVLLLVVAGGYAWALRRGPALGRGAGRPRAGGADGLRWALPAGFAALILGLINPYYIVLLAGLLGLHSLWLLAARRSARGLLAALGPAAGCALASLQYAVQRITANLGAIAMDDPVGPGHFALFFAVILPLAAAGWWWAGGPGGAIEAGAGAGETGQTGPGGLGDPGGTGGPALRDPDSLLAVWLVFGVLAVLSPVPFRVRLLLGLWVALAIPAAPLLARWGLRTPVPYLVLALLWVDVWYNFKKEARDVETGRVLIATAALDAFGWLEANAPPDSVVLAHALAANPIPAYAGVRVLIGHSFQTAGYYELHERVLEFYRAMPPGRQREFLDAHGVDYVLVGPLERPLLGTRPAAFPGMTRLYNARGYEIWGEGE